MKMSVPASEIGMESLQDRVKDGCVRCATSPTNTESTQERVRGEVRRAASEITMESVQVRLGTNA